MGSWRSGSARALQARGRGFKFEPHRCAGFFENPTESIKTRDERMPEELRNQLRLARLGWEERHINDAVGLFERAARKAQLRPEEVKAMRKHVFKAGIKIYMAGLEGQRINDILEGQKEELREKLEGIAKLGRPQTDAMMHHLGRYLRLHHAVGKRVFEAKVVDLTRKVRFAKAA
jgi:hypothetical protein